MAWLKCNNFQFSGVGTKISSDTLPPHISHFPNVKIYPGIIAIALHMKLLSYPSPSYFRISKIWCCVIAIALTNISLNANSLLHTQALTLLTSDLPALSRVWQHLKFSGVSFGARPQYSLFVDEDVEKPTKQTNTPHFQISRQHLHDRKQYLD